MKRFRFRVRTLMILVLVVGLVTGVAVQIVRTRRTPFFAGCFEVIPSAVHSDVGE
jgi:hypothetical protein